MIIDNHVHIGWFTDGYHTPKQVWDSLVAAGVDGVVVSSTSTCAELYKVVIRELRELVNIGGERVRPILWLSPKILKCRYALPLMLKSRIRWYGVKLHFEAHPEWISNKRLLQSALKVARRLEVPVLLHTGIDKNCHAARFSDVIAENQDLTFVLAHGRPVDETITLLKQFNNALTDTAFMPVNDLKKLIDCGLQDRILFGTDAPINLVYFKRQTTTEFVTSQIKMVRDICGPFAGSILCRTIYK